MSFELESVGGCIGAMRTLIGSFTSMTTNVPLQLAQLDTRIVTLWTLMGLFVSVAISDMPDQLA